MGGGRKTKTLPLKEKSYPCSTINCSAPARNLPKPELGAVIFGCKHHTIQECLRNLLFGLPVNHYSYVRHITPGLPLFLFNYSDRRLHGIFEAASAGQMNINRYAWINSEDSEYTPYSAQVRVQVVRRCRPLREEEFKPLIAANYYEERLFWFELDRRQARKLTNLFSASPLTEKISRQPVVVRSSNMFNALPSCADEVVSDESHELEWEELSAPTEELSAPTVELSAPTEELSVPPTEEFISKQDSWYCSTSTTTGVNSTDHEHYRLSALVDESASIPSPWCELLPSSSYDQEWKPPSSFEEQNKPYSAACMNEPDQEFLSSRPDAEEDHSPIGNDAKEYEACSDDNHIECASLVPDTCEDRLTVDQPNSAFLQNSKMISDGLLKDTEDWKYHSLVSKLMQEIEELKVSQMKQCQQISFLEHELVDSKLEINHLKGRCNVLESGSSFNQNYCEKKGRESLTSSEEHVLIVGGFDGHSWLPALSSYSPSKDIVKSLLSMISLRSYASAAKLNGEIYVFGGEYEDMWYDIVESYNATSGQWTRKPSLNRKKRSMAGATLCEKIYAIGGGNRTQCFSEVEEFDFNSGRWIFTKPMFERRFAPGAADINNALYVAGGYDGIGYLRSVERFDPREHSWNRLSSMNAKRGCHSLVAFNEKLYAMGGFDGTSIVPTVEVFDPRADSWMQVEPMKNSRGNFGAVVLGSTLYVMGGLGNRNEVLDTIECYEEGRGWQVAELRALGKRSFFSAFVL